MANITKNIQLKAKIISVISVDYLAYYIIIIVVLSMIHNKMNISN